MQDNYFLRLSDAVETIRQKQEERERIGQEMAGIVAKATSHYCTISEAYRNEERRIDERMEHAEAENADSKGRIVELTRQQIQAETAGEPFTMRGELDRLKAEVATYPQKVEALQSLKAEVVIAAADMARLEEYRREWQRLTVERASIENEMQQALIELRDGNIPYCLATFEVIPGRRVFLPDNIEKDIETMRKEHRNDE